jgi:hypothetical protein
MMRMTGMRVLSAAAVRFSDGLDRRVLQRPPRCRSALFGVHLMTRCDTPSAGLGAFGGL